MVYLENDLVRFGFERATGSLVEITDRITGQQHLADARRGRLFRVMCPNGLWQSRYADSHEAGPPEVSRDGQCLTIRYPRLRAMDGPVALSAAVHVELPADRPEALFTLEITNNSPDRLHEIRFPWVGGWTGLAGPSADQGVCGCVPVGVHPKAPETFAYNLSGLHRRQFHSYHGMQLPFFDLSGGGRGLSYICYQDRPNLGGMVLANLDPEPDGLSLSFSWVHFPFTLPGDAWQSPPVGVGVHQGDWHATADRFRAWLDTWWKAPQPPDRLARSIGHQVIQIRNFDGVPNHRFRDIPQLAEAGLRYGVEDLCVWDPIAGVYLRPDDGDFWEEFDPSQSLDDLRVALAEAKRAGTNVSVLVNYRLIRANSPLYRKIGEEQVQRTLFGSPISEEWSTCSSEHASFRTNYLGRQGVVLCQRSSAFRERALVITRQTLDLGFTSLFIDQAFDYNPCFAEHHEHRSPDDTHEAALEWFKVAAEMVRSDDPEAYVIGESTDVFGAQYLDLTWSWGWAHVLPQVMRYTLPETLHCWVVDHQPTVLNRAFVMGFLMAFTTGMAEQSLDAYPEFGARVARLAALRKRCAEYLAHGRFRDTLGLEIEGTTAYVYDAPDGLAVAFADTENVARSVRITLDPAALNRRAKGPRMLYRLDGSAAPAGEALPDGRLRMEVELPALDVAVWVVPCAPGQMA